MSESKLLDLLFVQDANEIQEARSLPSVLQQRLNVGRNIVEKFSMGTLLCKCAYSIYVSESKVDILDESGMIRSAIALGLSSVSQALGVEKATQKLRNWSEMTSEVLDLISEEDRALMQNMLCVSVSVCCTFEILIKASATKNGRIPNNDTDTAGKIKQTVSAMFNEIYTNRDTALVLGFLVYYNKMVIEMATEFFSFYPSDGPNVGLSEWLDGQLDPADESYNELWAARKQSIQDELVHANQKKEEFKEVMEDRIKKGQKMEEFKKDMEDRIKENRIKLDEKLQTLHEQDILGNKLPNRHVTFVEATTAYRNGFGGLQAVGKAALAPIMNLGGGDGGGGDGAFGGGGLDNTFPVLGSALLFLVAIRVFGATEMGKSMFGDNRHGANQEVRDNVDRVSAESIEEPAAQLNTRRFTSPTGSTAYHFTRASVQRAERNNNWPVADTNHLLPPYTAMFQKMNVSDFIKTPIGMLLNEVVKKHNECVANERTRTPLNRLIAQLS